MRHISCLIVTMLLSFSLNGQEALDSDWFMNDSQGISANEAYSTILKEREASPVIVAVIDSGIDVAHEDLQENIWVNTDEIPNNGIDDDKNGYIDDVNGWNFIGGKDGKNVGADSYEVTRVYNMLRSKYENIQPTAINSKNRKEYELFLKAAEEVSAKRKSAEESIAKINASKSYVEGMVSKLESSLDGRALDQSAIDSLEQSGDENVKPSLFLLKQYKAETGSIPTIAELKADVNAQFGDGLHYYQNQLDYAYNTDFDNRKEVVGDNYMDGHEMIYGNNDYEGPDALHGTHVGGIIGAVRNNDIGMNGVAENVRIMSVRAVPDGDERDKDVANAIRYAVDNGASIINMSFGKGYSPQKELVDDAIRYAEKKDVLLIHAAGNSAQDNDSTDNFPNDKYLKPKGFLFWKKKGVKNWIEVGALSYKKGEDMVAPFSNYGQREVDIFAPGVKIYSTLPNDAYRNLQGTSMASPVVAGVAAVLRSIYPTLSATQVKEVLMSSSKKSDQMVKKPGSGELVPFSELSVSGGMVNLKDAVIHGARVKGKKKIKNNKSKIGA